MDESCARACSRDMYRFPYYCICVERGKHLDFFQVHTFTKYIVEIMGLFYKKISQGIMAHKLLQVDNRCPGKLFISATVEQRVSYLYTPT